MEMAWFVSVRKDARKRLCESVLKSQVPIAIQEVCLTLGLMRMVDGWLPEVELWLAGRQIFDSLHAYME